MTQLYFSVRIEGEEVNDLVERVVIEESDSEADLATLVFSDSELVLSDVLHEGLDLEVDLGYRDAHTLVFRGMIIGLRADFPATEGPTVQVQAADDLIRLSLVPRTRRWWNTTVSQIVLEIAQSNDLLAGRIEPTADAMVEETHPLQQVAETDLAFLNRLARLYDSKLYIRHEELWDTLNLVSTQTLLDAEPVEQDLVFNTNLYEFAATFDAFATAPAEHLVTTDPLRGERVELPSGDVPGSPEASWTPDLARLARLGDGAARVAALVARSAPKRLRLSEFHRQRPRIVGHAAIPAEGQSRTLGDCARNLGQSGQGQAAGSVALRPRRRVRVVGYGGRWSGDWYLARVSHHVDVVRRSYLTSFTCVR
jgi:phage protein D